MFLSPNRRALVAAALAALTLFVVGCDELGSLEFMESTPPTPLPTPGVDEGTGPTNPIRTSAEQLKNERSLNKLRFKNSYEGRWVEITDRVKGVTDRGIIIEGFSRAVAFNSVVQLPEEELINLSRGEKVELVCRVSSGMMVDYYSLWECSTLWSKAIPATEITPSE